MIPDHSAFPLHDGAFPGLTKRELFAAMAMQGLLAFDGGMAMEWNGSVHSNTERNDRLVGRSRRIADALIAELSK